MRASSLLLVVVLSLFAAAGEDGLSPEKEAQARTLIEQIGSADFDEREKAEAELKKLGEESLQFLRRARDRNTDTETRRRLDRVIKSFAPGALLWEFNAGLSGRTLLVAEDKVFLQTAEDKLAALDAATGNKLWEVPVGVAPPAGRGKRSGVGNLLGAYAAGRLYVTGIDGTFFALDATTGKTVWQTAAEISNRAYPIVVNGRIYYGSEAGNLFCINTADGKVVWKADRKPCSMPASDGEKIWVIDQDYTALSCLNAADGAEVWSVKINRSMFCAPAVWQDKVIVGEQDGNLLAFNAADGKQLWKFECGLVLDFGVPIVADGKVYAGVNGQEFFCVNAADGKKIWQYKVSGAAFTPPIVERDHVFIGCYGNKYHVLKAGKGTVAFEWTNEHGIFIHAASAGRLFLLDMPGKLKCVRSGIDAPSEYTMYGGNATRAK